jgi:hypothetical protein
MPKGFSIGSDHSISSSQLGIAIVHNLATQKALPWDYIEVSRLGDALPPTTAKSFARYLRGEL